MIAFYLCEFPTSSNSNVKETAMLDVGKTIQIDARCKTAQSTVDALFDAFAVPSANLLAFSAMECDGEISALMVVESSHEAQHILETEGFECCAGPVGI